MVSDRLDSGHFNHLLGTNHCCLISAKKPFGVVPYEQASDGGYITESSENGEEVVSNRCKNS